MTTHEIENAILAAARYRWLSGPEIIDVARSSGSHASDEAVITAVTNLLFSGDLVGATGRPGQQAPWHVSRHMAVYKAKSAWGSRTLTDTWFASALARVTQVAAVAVVQPAEAPPEESPRLVLEEDWVQINRYDRIRAATRDVPAPPWHGSRLQLLLGLKRTLALLVLLVGTVWLVASGVAAIMTHQDPAPYFVTLVIGVVPVGGFLYYAWIAPYDRVRELLGSGERWHRVEAEVVDVSHSKWGTGVHLEAEGVAGTNGRFAFSYSLIAPLDYPHKGESFSFEVLTSGTGPALVRSSERSPVRVVRFA